MPQSSNHKSRRKTPWDNIMERTASQQFLFEAYGGMYQQRHPILLETGEDIDDYHFIRGNFFLCGLGREDFTDIPSELAQKYAGMS